MDRTPGEFEQKRPLLEGNFTRVKNFQGNISAKPNVRVGNSKCIAVSPAVDIESTGEYADGISYRQSRMHVTVKNHHPCVNINYVHDQQ